MQAKGEWPQNKLYVKIQMAEIDEILYSISDETTNT